MGCNQMIIQTQTIINILKELSELTDTDLNKELEECYNFFLIYEKEPEQDFEVKKLETLNPKKITVKLNNKVADVKSIFYNKRRKIYIINFENGVKKEIKKLDVSIDMSEVQIVELLRKFNIM